MIRTILHAFGYVVAHVLFLGADTPETVVGRLRLAYRLVGVDVVETAYVDGRERTVFLCPYRSLGRARYREKWFCHDVLDRVDDGYVTYLSRHEDIEYRRPRGCEELAYCENSEYCYSEVFRQ